MGVITLYRLTFKRKDGKTFQVELTLQKITEILDRQADLTQLIKIERINRITGNVMGGMYDR
jgi:hypothetical protein